MVRMRWLRGGIGAAARAVALLAVAGGRAHWSTPNRIGRAVLLVPANCLILSAPWLLASPAWLAGNLAAIPPAGGQLSAAQTTASRACPLSP